MSAITVRANLVMCVMIAASFAAGCDDSSKATGSDFDSDSEAVSSDRVEIPGDTDISDDSGTETDTDDRETTDHHGEDSDENLVDSEQDTDSGSDVSQEDEQNIIGVVTDIDETLTTSDAQWVRRMIDSDYDEKMRPLANTLMSSYHEKGYRIIYVTARGELTPVAGGLTARQATREWLLRHDFPLNDGDLYLADGFGVSGILAVNYKTSVLKKLQKKGWKFAYAYGNATTDIDAFLKAPIPSDRIFLVGKLAGTMDVESIPDKQAYSDHFDEHMPSVPSVQ